MWMHVQPEKVTISKQEPHGVAEVFKMNSSTHDSHPDNEAHLARKPLADTQHHPASHRPRQLSGRHH